MKERIYFMGLEKLISAIAVFVVLTASSGRLPKLIFAVRKAQIQLIQDTKASAWGMPYLLKARKFSATHSPKDQSN
jgi:hypothetical protein